MPCYVDRGMIVSISVFQFANFLDLPFAPASVASVTDSSLLKFLLITYNKK